MAKITQFNGGINTATAPYLIQDNEGIFYDNVDHIPGSLGPVKDKRQAVANAERFGHKFSRNSTWYWSTVPKDYVEFQERLYIGNRNGVSTKIVNGVEYNIGIEPPLAPPDVAATSYSLAELTNISLTAQGSLFNTPFGDIPGSTKLEYRFVNENATGQLSAAPDIHSNTTGSIPPYANIIAIKDENWTVNVHIYRLHLGLWKLMKTVAFDPLKPYDEQPAIFDDIYDISANTTLDEGTLSAVGQLNGILRYAITYYSSLTGAESAPVITTPEVTVVNGTIELTNILVSPDPQVTTVRIYRIGGNLTAFTRVDEINNGITSYTDNIHDLDLPGQLLDSQDNYPPPATGMSWLTESYAMLFAANGDKLIFTPIGQPDSWPQTYFLDFPAFITGIGKTPVGLLVFTQFETFLVTGTGPLALAQQLLTGSQGCIAGDSVVNIQGAAYWASTDGICISEGGRVVVYTRPKLVKLDLSGTINAVVYDQNYYILIEEFGTSVILDTERNAIKTTHYDINSYIVADDTLYGYKQGYLHEVEGAAENLSMTYLSPEYIGAGFTVQKVYKNIYVFSEGEIEVEVYIDEKLVQKVEFTDTDNHQIKVPTQYTRGFKIAFVIKGTGTVTEIRWDDGNANQ